MAADGIQRAACLVTSAYASYSGCRQYRENLYDAVAEVPGAPRLDRLRHYFNHPGFIDAMVAATLAALAELKEADRAGARVLFVTHSIPEAMNLASGPAWWRLCGRAPQRGRGDLRAGPAGDRRAPPRRAGVLLALRPTAACPGWSPT